MNRYILCVDDDRQVLEGLRRDLDVEVQRGYRIECCESAAEAEETIRELEDSGALLALIVCDQVMPGEGGVQFLERLKARQPDAKKILLTGYAGLENAIYGINRAELDGYLEKPWEGKTLQARVRELLDILESEHYGETLSFAEPGGLPAPYNADLWAKTDDLARWVDAQAAPASSSAGKSTAGDLPGFIELSPSLALGMLKKLLADRGVTDVRRVAAYMSALRRVHRDAGVLYSYDAYTEDGSAPQARLHDGEGHVRDCVMWSVNHYLGLNRHPEVQRRSAAAISRYGTGCGTSAMGSGLSSLHKELEQRLATLVRKERVLLFPTGFTANSGAIAGLTGKHDLILSDEENHASIIDGCRASRAKVFSFAHNDVEILEAKLRRYRGEFENALVIVESAYSMSGDLAPLREITALKREHDFMLFVDEAHSFGFYGPGGAGYCHALGVADEVDFIMSTLSKATASIGGFVATSDAFCTMLTWTARPYMFQAAFSPADAAAVLAALDEIESHPEHAQRLHDNNAYLRARLRAEGFDLRKSESPIVPVYISDTSALQQIVMEMYELGVFSTAITYPIVPPEDGRIRMIVNATHTHQQIDRSVDVIAALCRKHGVL